MSILNKWGDDISAAGKQVIAEPHRIVDPLNISRGAPELKKSLFGKKGDGGAAAAKITQDEIEGVRNKKADSYENTVGNVFRNTSEANENQRVSDEQFFDGVSQKNDAYLKTSEGITNDFVGAKKKSIGQLEDNMDSVNNIYDTSVFPQLKNIQEEHSKDIGSGLTLAELNDPNNRVASAYRQQYDNLADETGRRGLQNAGVLGSMGAQQTAQQFSNSGMPLSTGQMMAMGAMNNQQSGMAYARTQDEMNKLRQQGLSVGRDMAQNSYGARQGAIQGLQSSTAQMEGANLNRGNFNNSTINNISQFDGDIANSRQNHGDRVHGIGIGQDALRHGLTSNQIGRGLSNDNFHASGMGTADQMRHDARISALGGHSAIEQAQAQAQVAENQAKVGMFSTVVGGGAGAIAGGIAGGPQGAQMGAQMGSQMGQQIGGQQPMAQNMNPQQYGGGFNPNQNQYINPGQYFNQGQNMNPQQYAMG